MQRDRISGSRMGFGKAKIRKRCWTFCIGRICTRV